MKLKVLNNLRLDVVAAVLTLGAGVAFHEKAIAQQSIDAMVDGVESCLLLTVSAERYACYDKLENKNAKGGLSNPSLEIFNTSSSEVEQVLIQKPEQESSLPIMTQVPANSAGQKSAIDAYGSTARLKENDEGEEVLVDRILSLRQRLPNQWLITLESGQIWTQMNSERYLLKRGMEVNIYPSPFGGSFRLTSTTVNGFIQVRRVE